MLARKPKIGVINKLAETLAKELGLELFTSIRDRLERGLYSLESLGSEYVDASFEGKTKGVFRIHNAKKSSFAFRRDLKRNGIFCLL